MNELMARKEELEKRQKWFDEMEALSIEHNKNIERQYREMLSRFEDIKLAIAFASQKNTDDLFAVEKQIQKEDTENHKECA